MRSDSNNPDEAAARERRARRWYALGATGIVLIGAALRFWALDAGLPHLMTRPDEEVVLERTALPARGQFDLGWATYPNAYVYLCWGWGALGVVAAHVAGFAPTADYLAALRGAPDSVLLVLRSLSAFAGAAAVFVALRLARRTFGRGGAVVAAVLVATSFIHARESHAVKPEILLALAMLVAVGAMARLAREATVVRGLRAGVAVGIAMAVKYPGVLLLFPLWVAACMGSSRRGWRRLLPAAAVAGGVAAAVVFLSTSPYLFLNPKMRTQLVEFFGHIFPQTLAEASKLMPDIPGYPGYADLPWWSGWVQHVTFSLRYGLGLLPTLAAPVALGWGLWSRRPLAVLAAITAAVYFLAIGASPVAHARYMVPLVPLLALLDAGMLTALAARLGGGWRGVAFLVLATAALAAEPAASIVAHDRLAARTDTRVLATRWMAAHVPAGARLAALGSQVWFWGMPQVPPRIRYGPVAADAEAFAAAGVGYVLTHDHTLFSSRLDPEVMARLAPHLTLLVEFDPAVPGRTDALFEARDAYYLPMRGFDAVTRPGPRVRIYAFDATPAS
jgi:4-amino-4-deoxy-L-arabinose transferase-like glycosyltransferase